jgi:hypothetical protein
VISTIRRSIEWYPLRVLVLAVGPVVVVWLLVMGSVPVERTSALAALAIVVVPTTLVALSSSRAGAAEWALGRGARFAPEWNELLWHHLTRTRVARTLGVTLGIAASIMLNGIYNAAGDEAVGWLPEERSSSMVGGFWLLALGYVVGSVWAEARKPRRQLEHGAGAALLTPRRLGDYLDPNVAWALGLFGVYAASVAVVWAVVPLPTSSTPVLDAAWVWVVAPAVVVLLALSGAVWVSRRRERAADDVSLAYEELTRTATINALAGASIAMLAEFAGALASLPRGGEQISGWLLLMLGLVQWLGLGIWASCGTKLVFRNRRIDALRAAA